jgi:hypothetical protein
MVLAGLLVLWGQLIQLIHDLQENLVVLTVPVDQLVQWDLHLPLGLLDLRGLMVQDSQKVQGVQYHLLDQKDLLIPLDLYFLWVQSVLLAQLVQWVHSAQNHL